MCSPLTSSLPLSYPPSTYPPSTYPPPLYPTTILPPYTPPLQALRAVKGILNKLTPEKYERLLSQLLEVVTTADLLKQTISLVFENAVAQPTFCAM